ncbi:MAG TPA: cobalamin-binding protein [Burkholderiales bacterium]|nr:cobalamin-binding protein [Burkholderiales bacterium]
MSPRLRAALVALVALSASGGGVRAGTLRASDDRGAQIVLSSPARRVVTLAPHLTELAYAAGGAAAMVGADSASDYPPAAAGLPRVGDAAGLDLERILALRPELAFGWLSGNRPSDIARLRQLGVPVFLSEPRRLSDIPRTLRVMGLLLGTAAVAEQSAHAFERRLQELRLHAAVSPPVAVFFEVWHQPLITVTTEHLMSDVVALCGGYNVFGSLSVLAPAVSLESVLLKDPEAIIAAGVPPGALAGWDRFPRMRAVRGHQIYEVDADVLTRATPRVLDGAAQVCRRLEGASKPK